MCVNAYYLSSSSCLLLFVILHNGWVAPCVPQKSELEFVINILYTHYNTGIFSHISTHTVCHNISYFYVLFFICFLAPLLHHFLFPLLHICCFIIRNFLFLGQSVPSRSAHLCHPLWTLAPPQSQGLGRDLKLHLMCRHPVLNHPKSRSLWNWTSWQSCTVHAFLVSDHKVVVLC